METKVNINTSRGPTVFYIAQMLLDSACWLTRMCLAVLFTVGCNQEPDAQAEFNLIRCMFGFTWHH